MRPVTVEGAECAVWRRGTTGIVGKFAARDEHAAHRVLGAAIAALDGCDEVIGPMDGDTWHAYRFVVDAGTEPPFPMEPANPAEYPRWWESAGFAPFAWYRSSLNDDLAQRDERVPATLARLAANGVTVRTVAMDDFTSELRRIHALSLVGFRENFLYTPIDEAEFLAMYERVRPMVDPRFVFMAEHGDRPVGFSFSLPASRDTVIIKTMAILPERKLLGGLGSVFGDMTHAAAHAAGFTRAIHALMHESNASRALSDRTGRTMRRYALFRRALRPG